MHEKVCDGLLPAGSIREKIAKRHLLLFLLLLFFSLLLLLLLFLLLLLLLLLQLQLAFAAYHFLPNDCQGKKKEQNKKNQSGP